MKTDELIEKCRLALRLLLGFKTTEMSKLQKLEELNRHKWEILLRDGTWLEGSWILYRRGLHGFELTEVFRSNEKDSVPLAKRVFVPNGAITLIILED